VEYETVDVAGDEKALEEMRERTGKSFVPQVYIGDEYIGGYSDFLLRDARGDIDRLLGGEPEEDRQGLVIYDVIIIGGGPAGLSAGVYAARKNLKTLIISDQLGGQPMQTSEVENYIGYQFITGPELMDKFEQHTRYFDVEVQVGESISSLYLAGQLKHVMTEAGRVYMSHTVIIATGKRSRSLNIPGEYELVGRGVSYCATCDAPLFKGDPVMVVGSGNSGSQAALELADICPHVYLVSLSGFRADEVVVGKINAQEHIHQYLHWRPTEIKGGKSVESVVITSADGGKEEELKVSAVFIEVGLQPNSSFAVDLLDLNEQGEIVVDNDCRTGVQGIFAAGDITQVRDKQIVVAAGEGAKAALSAHEYLLTRR